MTARDQRAASLLAKIERGLARLHTNLRLIALNAPAFIVAESQRLLDLSVAETGLSEAELAKLYPTFRLAQLGREASEVEDDNRREHDPSPQGATDD